MVSRLASAGAWMGFLVGCGGSYESAKSAPYAPAMAETASATQPGGAPAPESARGAAQLESSSEARYGDAAPSARQGLGTSWGESRESWVQDTEFVRQSPDRPLRVFAIRYNDRAGIDAMVRGSSNAWADIAAPEVSVELRGEGGSALPTARVGERYFVTGQAGERYAIVVRNHSGRRLEVVASVDGLDVLNGKEASVSRRGYVVSPYESLEIDGFRQSQGSVAAFRFGSVGDSYAESKGAARNVGVIGVAVFGERELHPSAEELRLRNTASPFPASDPRYARPPR